jgi:aminoglycoside phosphotransferase
MRNDFDLKKSDLEKLITEIMGEGFQYFTLNGGHVAVTLLLESKDEKYVLQIWKNDFSNQSIKKRYIYSLLKNVDFKVPKVIRDGAIGSFTFLVTSFIKGSTLHDVEDSLSDANRKKIMNEIGYSLSIIHNFNFGESFFGWLNGETLDKKFLNLESYLESELERFKISLVQRLNKEDWERLELIVKRSILTLSKSSHVPSLNWYDVQLNNVMVENKNGVYSLSGFLDPGAARFGIPEWDIAHAKIHLCRNADDLINLIDGYGLHELDMNMVDAFVPIVLTDDLSLGYDRDWQFAIDQTIPRLKELRILS